MMKTFSELTTNARFHIGDETLLKDFKTSDRLGMFTFIRTIKQPASLIVDSMPVTVSPQRILALTTIQFLEVINLKDAIVYQFNREFYCIRNHDKEVSCAGLLFFGNNHIPVVTLTDQEEKKYNLLHEVFLEEMKQSDPIQSKMLRLLMARYISKTTRLLKQDQNIATIYDSKIDLIRKFNVLVEAHFREDHSVAFYAKKLSKSPKTLSNNFSKTGKSPLQIIHDRIILEAKRQLSYTTKTAKEIAFEIGFDDPSHLSRMFKNNTGLSPTAFKEQLAITG